MIIRKSNFDGWEKLRYHPVQAELWKYSGKFAAIVAGRGSGKTEICRRKLVLEMGVKKPWDDPLYFYVLPTFAQAKRVAWFPIVKMFPKNWITKDGINKTDLSITCKNGSKLYVVGADKPERLEGVQADTVMIDESSDQRPGLFDRTIVPMLSHRNGRCYRLGVPKRSGIGKVEFRDFFNRGLRGEGEIASFHWKTIEVLTPEQKIELEKRKETIDSVTYAEQFEAQWIDVGSNVYYNFSSDNIRDDIKYNPIYPLYVGCDFNVSPMCWVVSQFIDDKMYVIDEIALRDTNTPSMIDFLYGKYRQHSAGWKFFGDASSRSRKTSATRSDYLYIKNDARFGEKKVFFPHKNPNIRDRIASVNTAFKTASNIVRCYVSTECKKLINDMNMVSYREGTTELEDYSGTEIGHMADAFGYMIHTVMPIKLEVTSVPEIWSRAG